jgi:hypothetical protein
MIDWLIFFKDLAVAFFKPFASAVQEYPVPTALVFIVAAFVYFERLENREKHDPLAAFIIFICAVFAANVLGRIFNAVLWILKQVFGTTVTLAGPFGANPIAFLLSLLGALVVGFAYLLYRQRFRWRDITMVGFTSLAFSSLFFAYVFTSIYVQVTAHPETTAKSIESKKN